MCVSGSVRSEFAHTTQRAWLPAFAGGRRVSPITLKLQVYPAKFASSPLNLG